MKSSVVLCLALSTGFFAQHTDMPGIKGPYLGQNPPGMNPVPFHSELFSKDREQHDLFFGPGGLEAVWAERNPADNTFRFLWTRTIRGIWSEPVVLPFSTEYFNVELCLSPDGKRLFFASDRPAVPGGETEKMPDIWMSERAVDGWGEPQRLAPPVNSPDLDGQPYGCPDGKLYFIRQSGTVRNMMSSTLREGASAEIVPFGVDLFQEQFAGFCVSPDERIMLLHSRKEGGFGSWDLYASFKDAAGRWGEPINLGKPINTEGSEGGAAFSPDGRFLFFSRERRNWWVDSRILDEINPFKK